MARTLFQLCTPSGPLQRSSMKHLWMDTQCTINFLIRIKTHSPCEAFSTLTGLTHRNIHSSTWEYMRPLIYYTLSVTFYKSRCNIQELCEHHAFSSSELDPWWSASKHINLCF